MKTRIYDEHLKRLSNIVHVPPLKKYRIIDTTMAGFQRSLANAPGAMDFFKAMHFYRGGNASS
jgi:hypothetical protein